MYVVKLNLKNEVPLTAFQMDLYLEKGVTLTRAQLSSRATNHSLAINDLGDGTVRLLSSSVSNDELVGKKGDLLTLEFSCEPQMWFFVGFNNILMAEPDMTVHEMPVFSVGGESGPISVNELTSGLRISGQDGMVVVETPSDTMVELINPNGMIRTVAAKAGVNTYPVERGICIVRVAGQVTKLKF